VWFWWRWRKGAAGSAFFFYVVPIGPPRARRRPAFARAGLLNAWLGGRQSTLPTARAKMVAARLQRPHGGAAHKLKGQPPLVSTLVFQRTSTSTHNSAPVVAMVWEGKNVVATGRKIIGATNPLASEPGTIR
jgi:Nucleoside diphosphate kinase